VGWLKIISVAIGLLLVRLAVPYPGELVPVQERINAAWFRTVSAKELAVAFHVRVTQRACTAMLDALSWIFGEAKFGVRVVWVSLMWGMGSVVLVFLIGILFVYVMSWHNPNVALDFAAKFSNPALSLLKMAAVAWSFFAAGLIPGAVQDARTNGGIRRWLVAALLPVHGFVGLGTVSALGTIGLGLLRTRMYHYVAGMFGALVLAVSCDVLFLAVYRWALRRCAEEPTWGRGFTTLVALSGLSSLLFQVPFSAVGFIGPKKVPGATLVFVALSNSFDVLLCFALIGVIGALLLHRLMWEPWHWVLHVAQEYLPNRKVVAWLGGLFIVGPFIAPASLLLKLGAFFGW
jgi:hypothetical protein